MNEKLISIITPTYNRPHLLKRSIQSAVNQTYTKFEIIIIDSSTNEESKNMLELLNDNRIKYFKMAKNGVASAKNAALELSVGDFIAFLDDDDEWLPNKLLTQVKAFENDPEIGLVHSNSFFQMGNKITLYHSMIAPSERELLKYDFISNGTTLIRKECFEKIGNFDKNIIYGEDWDFYIRLSKQFRFKYISEPLTILHETEINTKTDRMGQNFSLRVYGLQRLIEKHRKDYQGQEKDLAKYLVFLGSGYYKIGNKQRGKEYLVDAIRAYPNSILPLLLLISNSFIFHKLDIIIKRLSINHFFSSNYYDTHDIPMVVNQ